MSWEFPFSARYLRAHRAKVGENSRAITSDRWDDPQGWREHLLHGACSLLNAKVGMMLTEHEGRRYHFGRLAVTSVVGVPEHMTSLVQPSISQMQNRDYQDVSDNFFPGLTRLYEDFLRQGWVTISRCQVTSEAAYHAAPYYLNFRRQLDCDDFLVSIRMVDVPRRPEGITIDRAHGAEGFGPREIAILKLLHDEVGALVGVRLATEEHLCRDGLSKRLRETLSFLLQGLSEKQVAGELDLSFKTAHEYVGILYKHFHVSSRGELMAYFIRREPMPRRADPRLARCIA